MMRPLCLFTVLLLVAGHASAAPPMSSAGEGEGDETRPMLRSRRDAGVDESGPVVEVSSLDDPRAQRALSSSKCDAGESYLICDITTDTYGFENSWRLLRNTNKGPKELYSGPPEGTKYDKRQRYVGGYCLPPGTYRFIMNDLFKDGMCCSFGRGSYAGYLDRKKIFSSPEDDENWVRRGHTFTVPRKDAPPFDAKTGDGGGMTQRDNEWLASHNTRRKEWHERYGKSYAPLQWSEALKDESKVWAEKLADDCDLEHDPDGQHGENIALNYGRGSSSGRRSTENILTRFVEGEASLSYPENGHLTQVIWRASKYVGCADAVRSYQGGKCHAQVCRYSKPGNCNLSRYKADGGEWWLKPMLMNDSTCGDEISG